MAAVKPPLDPAQRLALALKCRVIIGTWEWDIAKDRFSADQHCAEALHLDFETSGDWLPGAAVKEKIHPDDWPLLAAILAPGKNCHVVEFRARRDDGSYRWLQTSGASEQDEFGAPHHFAGVLIDIDAHKQTEENLRQSEAKAVDASALLQAVIEAVPALIYVKDRDGRMQVANAPVMGLVGKPWADIQNRTDAEFLDNAAEGEWIMATDRRLMETAGVEELEEIAGNDISGQRIWLSQKRALLNTEGVVTGLVGVSVDITERKRAEQKVAASEAHLRNVIDNMFAFVGIVDLEGNLLEANRAPMEGAGLKREDVLGRPFWDAYWWSYDPEVRERVKAAAEKAAAGETSRFDVEIAWRDGRRITIDFQIAPLRDESGEVIQLIPSGVDITARKVVEAQRQTLILELNHRVKNLFSVASAMINMSARKARSADELARVVTGRLAALSRAHDLIRPALTGEAQSDGAQLQDLIAALIAPHVVPDGQQLQLGGPPVPLAADAATALALIFHELATNSAKYGALSHPDGRLDICWACDADRLVLKWSEAGGPAINGAPDRQGFGSQLIKSTVEGKLAGSIDFEWAKSGLLIDLMADLQQLTGQKSG
jgi:two-component system CheB/CheR fusion protein